jgi:ATP-dependent protease Clp ATPase subunit
MSAQIILFNSKQKPALACSFCGTTAQAAKKLIEGMNGRCICDKCIAKATALIKATDQSAPQQD